MNLNDFIYNFNLVTTKTITDIKELCTVQKVNKQIDYSESISLIDMLNLFNQAYLKFLSDFKEVATLEFLGKKISFENFYFNSNTSVLYLSTAKPNLKYISENWYCIYIINYDDNNIDFIATNGLDGLKRKSKKLDIPNDIKNAYLSLMRKHKLFLDSYFRLKENFIFGNGTTVLFSKIYGDILTKLNSFELAFGNLYFNCEDIIKIRIDLGEKLKINSIDKKGLADKIQVINELLNKLYISTTNLPSLFKEVKEQNLTKTRKNNFKN